MQDLFVVKRGKVGLMSAFERFEEQVSATVKKV